MRFCTTCGSRLTEGARFCTSCGAPVVVETRPHPSAPPSPSGPAPRAATPASASPRSHEWRHTNDETNVATPADIAHVSAPPAQGDAPASPHQASPHQPALRAPADPSAQAPHRPPTQAPREPSRPQHSSLPWLAGASTAPPGASGRATQDARVQSLHGQNPHGQNPQTQSLPLNAQNQPPTAHSAPGQPSWPGGATTSPFEWRAHLPGILRLVAAVALAFTALGNWWVIDGKGANAAGEATSYGDDDSFDPTSRGESWFRAFLDALDDHSSTMHHVLPLIGVVGVVLAVLAQVVLMPGIAGGQMSTRVRFFVRAALCLPALAAVVVAPILTIVTPESNVPAVAQVLLAMAAGLALAGLDDERDSVVIGVMRWGTVMFATLGALLQVVLLILLMVGSGHDSDHVPAWAWLIIVSHFLLIAGLGALVAFYVAAGRAARHNLVIALAVALGLCLLLRGWMQNNLYLTVNYLFFQGPGLVFVTLAIALGTACATWGRTRAEATEPAAERWISWVPTAFVIAALSCTVDFVLMVAARVLLGKAPEEYTEAANKLNENSRQVSDVLGFSPKLPTAGGTLWMAILLALLALGYGLLAALVRRHAQGRLLALILVPTLVLTVLVTYAASSVFALVSLTFDAFALWLPLLATAALVLPASVRAASGPLMTRPVAAGGQAPGDGSPRASWTPQPGSSPQGPPQNS